MIDVVLLASGADEVRLVHAFATELPDRVKVVRRCADYAEALSAVRSGIGDAIIIDIGLTELDRSSVSQLQAHSAAVIGLLSPDAAVDARNLGIFFTLDAGADAEAAYMVLLEAVASSQDGSAPPDAWQSAVPAVESAGHGRVIAVWGPRGSTGRSTIAAHLAYELSLLGRDTVLIDADTAAPSQSQLLGILDEAPGIVAAARLAARGALSSDSINQLTPVVTGQLRILSGIGVASRWSEVDPDALTAVIHAICALDDVVVIDCAAPIDDDGSAGPYVQDRNGAARAALRAATDVLCVVGANPISLTRLIREADELAALTDAPRHLLLNRVDRAVSTTQMERSIRSRMDVASVTEIPDDPALLSRLVWDGALLGEAAPRSAVRRALAAFAAQLDAAQQPAETRID